MKKIGTLIISFTIVIFCIANIIIKKDFNLSENIYVVSESETNKKEETQKESKSNQIDNTDRNKEEIKNIKDEESENTNEKMITVYVSGEVNKPGVITIENDKRLFDVVDQLGGFTENADLNSVNLAIKLNDEEHYIIPKIGEEVKYSSNYGNTNSTANNFPGNNSKENSKININNATIEELDTLPGVGEATANKIIKHREEKGQFNSVEEIKNVNGIGDKKYEDLKDLICIN